MGVSPLVAVLAVAILFIVVGLIWWLRYNENKGVVREISRRPQPYLGRLANNIYQIPLSHNYIYQTPPPTFSKAVKFPVPRRSRLDIILEIEEVPPPTYEQYLKAQQGNIHASGLPHSKSAQTSIAGSDPQVLD